MFQCKKICAWLLASTLALSMSGCGTDTGQINDRSDISTSSASHVESSELHPAYSTGDFQTVDANGNRITTGRDATASSAMVSSSKYEVSLVGQEILQKGGNAIDAAVAMGFALGVCEPFTSGLGGGGMATIHTASGENIFLDFREVAPAGATLDLYAEDSQLASSGGLASGVPGEVAGLLYLLEEYGTLSREEVMEPAIRIAEEGFIVTSFCAESIANAYTKALQYPEMQSVYCTEDGLPLEAGSLLTNPDLAKALTMISEEGAQAFYTGEIAQAVVDSLSKYGGVMTMEDLEQYQVQVLEPVSSTYRGNIVISAPPPSSGGTHLIEILNILEQFDVASLEINSPKYIHLFTEAYKLAFADRDAYMADPNFNPDIPLDGLTSKEYAAERAALIDLEQAASYTSGNAENYEHTDTTHFSVADAQGNCVSITKTINSYFGSGVMVEGYGFMMNNQMSDFSLDPENVNCIEPGKKPLSSMSPTVVLHEDGSPYLVMGTPGGARIFSSIAQTLSRVIDHGLSIQDAICVPKVWNASSENHLEYESCLNGYEQYEITEQTLEILEQMGHGSATLTSSGSVQAIEFLEDGKLYGTADPRQDGKALGVD